MRDFKDIITEEHIMRDFKDRITEEHIWGIFKDRRTEEQIWDFKDRITEEQKYLTQISDWDEPISVLLLLCQRKNICSYVIMSKKSRDNNCRLRNMKTVYPALSNESDSFASFCLTSLSECLTKCSF